MVQAEGNRALYLSLCDKGWNINTANVTCRELGFPEGARFVYYGTHFPSKKTAFDSRQWVCRGDEQDTEACGLDALRKCNGTAGVQCINPASKCKYFFDLYEQDYNAKDIVTMRKETLRMTGKHVIRMS